MRVLLLVKSDEGAIRRWARRNYLDFYCSISKLCPKFYHYGPGEQEYWGKERVPLDYDVGHTMDDILRELRPCIVIVWSWATSRKWVPRRTKYSRRVPFVILSGDYFSVPKDALEWYDQWDVMIHRGSFNFTIEQKIPAIWMPQSVNEIEFFTDPKEDYLKDRINKIVFMGNISKFPPYRTRRDGLSKLGPTGYLENIGLLNYPAQYDKVANGLCSPEEIKAITQTYPQQLKNYIGAFTCAGHDQHSNLAKHFEIMGSGTAMLTQTINFTEVLFGKDQCFFTYKDDLSDLISTAKEILNDHDKVKEVTENALRIINKHHLHRHRRVEFYNILKAMVDRQKIPRVWGM